MDDTSSKADDKKINSFNVEMSAEDNKIEYYEYNDENCIFKISEEHEKEEEHQKCIVNEELSETEENIFKYGEIVVTSILECGENEYLQGVKINLYKINGLSPVLITSKITDVGGNVVFSEVQEGSYRIIEIIDKRYFEKPKYINWNEIVIDSVNKNHKIIIVNKIKKFLSQNKHKHVVIK